MVKSMTGFGRSIRSNEHIKVTVEVKTVNHRFAEYHFRIPRSISNFEDKLKKKLNEYIKRGRIEVFIAVEGEGLTNRKLSVDWNLLQDYLQYIKEIQDRFQIQEEVPLKDILKRDEIFSIEEQESGNEYMEELVLDALLEAAQFCVNMREAEGKALQQDIRSHIEKIQSTVEALRQYAPTVTLQYANRLKKRIQEYVDLQLDEMRIVTEVAIFADKADINEELTRLDSHIVQFNRFLNDQEPVGRKLDFLVQEMNRETNTIGSKANDAKIAAEVVELKSLIEKIKEQIQNIE
ncbi:YicC/YloC family endoribonuclease [Robertmurraya korlensis]|uniref:YicC/YloC family endoribonuclease n=1 Tax=Robertmurraya korlensis TaxID=519977 RepID=UPI000825831B|nr:YicC/YloC family endoribonuclease [Robertmurraya korlensis]